MKFSLGISNFLEEISSLSHPIFSPYFFYIVHLRRLSYLSLLFSETLHSDGYIFPFLLCLSFNFFSPLFVQPPQTAVLPCCISVWGDVFGLHLQYHVINLCSLFFMHSVCQIQSFESICHFCCKIIRDLILIIPEWPNGFPYFLQFKSEFCNKIFMIWTTVSSWSCCCWLYRAFPYLVAKNVTNLIFVLSIWWSLGVELSLVLLEEDVFFDHGVLLAKLC